MYIPDLKLSLATPDDGSSMSDVSAISNTSNKTYVSEDSSLVLETLESGRHHHYLIPMAAARRAKLKKAGTKLHIYMDHIFTAQHIKLWVVISSILYTTHYITEGPIQ